MTKRVFISKVLQQDSPILAWAKKHNYEYIAEPQIEIRNNSFELPDVDWIFFSSKNGVNACAHLKEKLKNYKLGVIGESTKKQLLTLGLTPHFTGQGNDTQEIALDFSQFLENDSVCFASSNLSSNNMSEHLAPSQKVILETYQTILSGKSYSEPHFDVLIFTSPSNVKAFTYKNNISTEIIISIGKSTSAYIEKTLPKSHLITSIGFSEEEISATLESELSQK